jgi:transposase
MAKQGRYPQELRERAVRMVQEHRGEYTSGWQSIAGKFEMHPVTLHEWVKRAEVDAGQRAGLTTSERERLKQLERENRELRRGWRVDRSRLKARGQNNFGSGSGAGFSGAHHGSRAHGVRARACCSMAELVVVHSVHSRATPCPAPPSPHNDGCLSTRGDHPSTTLLPKLGREGDARAGLLRVVVLKCIISWSGSSRRLGGARCLLVRALGSTDPSGCASPNGLLRENGLIVSIGSIGADWEPNVWVGHDLRCSARC